MIRLLYKDIRDVLDELTSRDIIRYHPEHGYYINPWCDIPTIPESLGFSDIGILQAKNICKSRLDTDISSEVFRGVVRPIPMMASNMLSVANAEFCIRLYELGALGVMHRAALDDKLVPEVAKIAAKCEVVCASVGIDDTQFFLAKRLVNAGANVIFIDVAHGYSDIVIELSRKIKKELGVCVVPGNTINVDMLEEVADFADALKIGIGGGLSCETKNTAACHEKQFTAVLKFSKRAKELGVPIISDGGIREPADLTKAIAAGANSVMAGGIFARCPESAAETVEVAGCRKKVYAGMASRHVQNAWKNGVKKGTCPEGKISYLDIGEPVENLLERYTGALRSGITYAGARDVPGFQNLVKFVRV